MQIQAVLPVQTNWILDGPRSCFSTHQSLTTAEALSFPGWPGELFKCPAFWVVKQAIETTKRSQISRKPLQLVESILIYRTLRTNRNMWYLLKSHKSSGIFNNPTLSWVDDFHLDQVKIYLLLKFINVTCNYSCESRYLTWEMQYSHSLKWHICRPYLVAHTLCWQFENGNLINHC